MLLPRACDIPSLFIQKTMSVNLQIFASEMFNGRKLCPCGDAAK